MTEIQTLQNQVIDNGYCIGCGACASLERSPFRMKFDEYGNYIAVQENKDFDPNLQVLKVCPFSNQSLDETELSNLFFPKVITTHPQIGKFSKCFAGFVETEPFRKSGSSGGFGKWIGYKLLALNKIDYYVHVVSTTPENYKKGLFEYTVEQNANSIYQAAKSTYYPVTLDEIIKEIKSKPGRYAITGVPCFIKTIRLLSLNDETFKSKILFTIGIVCGGMKSGNHTKLIAWQLGIQPDDIKSIDFRVKSNNHPATHKIYEVQSLHLNNVKSDFSHNILGTGWNGYFTPKACFFCDDVVGETADVSLGDAWLPQYKKDPGGTNVIVVRNKEILEIIETAFQSKEVYLEELTAEEVAKSQEGGFRQRREALSYRVEKKEHAKEWYPKKRVASSDFSLSNQRKKIYSYREKIAEKSHYYFLKAYQKNDLHIFNRNMTYLEYDYIRVNIGNLKFIRFLLSKVKGTVLKFFKK
jgi:coenzyme F420-reducing hydrogenase beta subunit